MKKIELKKPMKEEIIMKISFFIGFLVAMIGSLFEPITIEAMAYSLGLFSIILAVLIIFWEKGK